MSEDIKDEQVVSWPAMLSEETKRMRDKDVLFGIVLILGSCALIVYSLVISFQAMETMKADFYVAPGFPSLVVGVGLAVLGIALVVIALKQGGDLRWLLPGKLIKQTKSKPFWQTVAVFFYLYLYMCLLWERIPVLNIRVPFGLTTFVFLCVMMITFKATRIRNIVIISGLTSLIIVLAFGYLAEIPLP